MEVNLERKFTHQGEVYYTMRFYKGPIDTYVSQIQSNSLEASLPSFIRFALEVADPNPFLVQVGPKAKNESAFGDDYVAVTLLNFLETVEKG